MNYVSSIHHARKVMKCDPVTKKTLKIYDSVTEAAKDIEQGTFKAKMSDICKCANGQLKTAAGFLWVWKPLEKAFPIAKSAENLKNEPHK